MLSTRDNERLTQVGPGTPTGELMRRYWFPIAATLEMEKDPTKAVRLLGEDLVLYKDRSGTFGLIQESCPHRRVNLLYGIPEEQGLRCPYHGWRFDETGRCLEMPAEAPDSTFKDRVTALTYPVQELGGLIFAYMGPEPVPLLPRWDLFVRDDFVRDIYLTDLPCNWLQCMENSMDPVHTEWLHSYWTFYQMEREGKEVPKTPDGRYATFRHTRIGFDVFKHGIIKRRLMEGQTEDHDDWKIGHPVIFPYTLRNGNGFQIRVPVDDTHTHHITYRCSFPKEGEEREPVRIHDMPIKDKNGKVFTHQTLYQDMWAWWSQGPLAQRHLERLAESDKGIILFRRLLKKQVDLALDGGDPMNVIRDPAKNHQIDLHTEQTQYMAFIGNTNVEEAAQGRSERAMRSLAGFQNTKEA